MKYLTSIRDDKYLNIVLEYVENGSMHDIIVKFGVLPEGLVQIYTTQILSGLCYLHTQGIIHR